MEKPTIVVLKNDHSGVHLFKIEKMDNKFWYNNLVGDTEQEALTGGTDNHPYGLIDRQTVLNMIDALKEVLK